MKSFKEANLSLYQDIMKCIEEADSEDTNKSRFFRKDYMEYLMKGVENNLGTKSSASIGKLMSVEVSKMLKNINQTYDKQISMEDLLKDIYGESAAELTIVGSVGALVGLITYGGFAVAGYALVIETTTMVAGSVTAVTTTAITAAATAGLALAVVGVGAGIWAIVKASWTRNTAIHDTCEHVF